MKTNEFQFRNQDWVSRPGQKQKNVRCPGIGNWKKGTDVKILPRPRQRFHCFLAWWTVSTDMVFASVQGCIIEKQHIHASWRFNICSKRYSVRVWNIKWILGVWWKKNNLVFPPSWPRSFTSLQRIRNIFYKILDWLNIWIMHLQSKHFCKL